MRQTLVSPAVSLLSVFTLAADAQAQQQPPKAPAEAGDPVSKLKPFPVKDYMQNSNSLRGNTYRLECTVGDQLGFHASVRLFDINVDGEDLALRVPAALKEVNIQKGQRFIFKVEVLEKGVIQVLEAKKS